jgi:SAM-dependent methyltransferase
VDLTHFPDRPAYDIGTRAMATERGPRGEDFARQILATVAPDLPRPVDQLDVLDVGSGYGHTALALAQRCRRVVGIEPCAEPAREAERLRGEVLSVPGSAWDRTDARLRLAAPAGPDTDSRGRASQAVASQAEPGTQVNLEFHHATLEGFATAERFDLIILDNVLEHLPDQPGSLRRIHELLRPGGVLYLLVPNKYWPIEVHYHLPFLGWLPLDLANLYLRLTGKGHDYRDASYAPGFLKIIRLMNRQRGWTWRFALPANLDWTTAGSAWHYRLGVGLLKRFPLLWAISKAFLIVAKKRGPR